MAELRLQVGIGIGPEACPLVTSELSSLDFLINRFFMKMFRTNNIEIVRNCQSYLGFNLPSELWR